MFFSVSFNADLQIFHKTMNVERTRKTGLCVSCEICNAVCPVDAIDMELDEGQFLPKVDKETCIDCEKCVEICPGLDITIFEKDVEEKITGSYLEGYSAYTKNQDILKDSTSGGVITQLIIDLLEKGEYEGAFVLPFDMFKGEQARLRLAENEEEVRRASKSKYLPASVYNVVERVESEEEPNYIIVGTPCQLSGIKKFLDLKDIDRQRLLFLGLFCDKTLNFNFLDYMGKNNSEEGEKIVHFDYRNKEKDGWPGHVKAEFDSGREKIIDRKERMRVKNFFQLERCLYCLDKLNRQADISFGDCYIDGKKNPGRSSIIIRTKKGREVWEEHNSDFNWEKSSVETIKISQSISNKRDNLEFAKILSEEADLTDLKISSISKKKKKRLQKRRKKIELGRKKKYSRIKNSLAIKKIKGKFGGGLEFSNQIFWPYLYFLKDLNRIEVSQNKEDGGNVILFGGNLINKGAQAMTFTTVDQIKRRHPDKELYLFTRNEYDEKEKEKYDFEIVKFDWEYALDIFSSGFDWSLNEPKPEKDLIEILKNADAFIDISGFGLSSQTTPDELWGVLTQIGYLVRIMLAKEFSVPYFIFPQSIGPFDYDYPDNIIIHLLFSKYIGYPEKIFPREPQGVDYLRPYSTKDVEKKMDIVLTNDGYETENIFSNNISFDQNTISNNSVGIIPNEQLMKRADDTEKIYELYEEIIDLLKSEDKFVYILRHSQSDLYICENIKKSHHEDDSVMLLSEDINALELENIIKNFDFIVGSRYHSIIHSYKNNVPALAIGWANKYRYLLKYFEQLDYHYDYRDGLDKKKVIDGVKQMLENYRGEKKKISNKIDNLEKNEVFERVRPYLE